MAQQTAYIASQDELKQFDLTHYDELSKKCHHWSSGVPRAIEFYYEYKKMTLFQKIKLAFTTKKKGIVQQTAVEWLQIKMATSSPQEMVENINVWFKEAKQMEKERHDKWNEFLNVEKTLGNSDVKTIERIQWYYNQYFKETYEK